MENDSKPLKIAHIVGKWVGGGVESVIMNYYENINNNKIQFDFICDDDSTNIPYDKISKLNGRVIIVPSYKSIFKYLKELNKIFSKENYIIIHSHINTLSIFPLYIAKKNNIPIRIAHSHSTANFNELKKSIVKEILRHFSKLHATHYFACGELSAKYLFGKKTYDNKRVMILNNAVNYDNYKFNLKLRKEVRNKLNISEKCIVIGHVGRFVKQKNHNFLIDVFYDLYKNNDKYILILIGQGPLENKIKNKVNKLGLNSNVIFLGQIDNVQEYYNAFDLFVLPSLYEGLPVVGIEAQINGLFCLLSDNITKESKIIKTTQFIPNKKELWVNKIFNNIGNIKRENNFLNYKFDIKKQAIELEKKYIELYRSVK